MEYDNFFLPVDNMEEAKKFYQTVLELSLAFSFEDRGLIGIKVGNEEPAIILKDKNKFPESKPTIWLTVDNLHERYEKMKKQGIRFLSEPFKINKGIAVEFEDPFGNRLGFTEYTS